MSLKCPNCGAAVPDNARFCPECGTAIQAGNSAAETAETAPREKPKMVNYNLIYLVLLLSLVIVGIYGYPYLIPPAKKQAATQKQVAPEKMPPVDQRAMEQLQARLKENPNNAQANIDMGNFLFDHQRFTEAIKYYQKALELEPRDTAVIVDLGVCYFNLHELDTAKQYFERALKIDNKQPNALYNLGVVYAQQGNMDAMLQTWNKLIEVAPESGPAQTARQMIEQVKSSMGN